MGLVLVCAAAARAQPDRRGIDVEIGLGFAAGSGAENPAPSLGTGTFGAGVWLGERWGAAVMLVRSFGEDLLDPPVESSDRTFLGSSDLRYTRIVARYRRPLAGQRLVIGFGFVRNGSFADIVLLHTDEGPRRMKAETTWTGGTGEVYWQQRLLPHLSLRAGLTVDTNVETTVFQPLVLGVLTF